MSEKPYCIRVRVLDGKPRDIKALNKLKSNQLGMPHLDIINAKDGIELIICAAKETHLAQVREKLRAAGLEEIEGGDTTITAPASKTPTPRSMRQGGPQQRNQAQGGRQKPDRGSPAQSDLRKKPYGFVSLPDNFKSAAPIWHDGTSSKGRLSGEIRFELETLTPLLVGWERGIVGDSEAEWPVPNSLDGVGQLAAKKSVLCPLRAPWGKRPVVIPGDSLRGLLRHELGALLGAPMERVAERSYSYRPNAMYPRELANRFLVPRLARVPKDGVEMKALDDQTQVRVPTKLELLPTNLRYDKRFEQTSNYYRFDDPNGAPYRGGLGAGERLNSKQNLHKKLAANPDTATETVEVPNVVQEGYLATLRHLIDLNHGHFSARHPDVHSVVDGEAARKRILEAAQNEVFQPGDMIWVEWDTEKKQIVSFGWHYYYRWAYVDTVRRDADAPNGERHGLFPLDKERQKDSDGAPKELSPVRRLFGYTGDNEGSAGIGEDDYAQLMGRVSINAALEVVGDDESDEQRFLPPTFLKELGMPRPSAVEFYLKQPYHPDPRPWDQATLVTYGDAEGYDEPGELAGRKFYLDRPDAYTGEPWKDDSPDNRANERSTLALEASKPGRRFCFTLRFRDLDPAELAAVLVALSPNQFKDILGGTHPDGYCTKLGYARPLGWGSVRIEAKQLLLLDEVGDTPTLKPEADLVAWVRQHYQRTVTQNEWLAIHRHKHPDAADYPRQNGQIYTFHTNLRAQHSCKRRYRREE
jgi:CRISPR-associated protein (TIGR03986 family)